MAMIVKQGTCKYCHQSRMVKVGEHDAYTQEDIDRLATDECSCDAAQKARQVDIDYKRCEKFIAEVISKKFPYMTDILEMDLQSILNEESDKITRQKDGYKFITGPTKKRYVDIEVKWSMESKPDAKTPLTAYEQGQRIGDPIPEEKAVPEEI